MLLEFVKRSKALFRRVETVCDGELQGTSLAEDIEAFQKETCAVLRDLDDPQRITTGRNTSAGEIVNHPPHYNKHPSGVECIDVIEWMPHNIGAAVKYVWRMDLKHPGTLHDLNKAIWYLRRERARLQGQHEPAEEDDGQ